MFGSDDSEDGDIEVDEDANTQPVNREILEDSGYWEPEAVGILQPFKEEWCEGNRSNDVIDRAITALLAAGIGKRKNMRKVVKLWLQRRSIMRYKYGPGHKPSLRAIVTFYCAEEIAHSVDARFQEDPGLGKKDRIGIYASEVSSLLRRLQLPNMKEKLVEMEGKRQEWTKKGPPAAARRL